jgi:hypothetical protein
LDVIGWEFCSKVDDKVVDTHSVHFVNGSIA